MSEDKEESKWWARVEKLGLLVLGGLCVFFFETCYESEPSELEASVQISAVRCDWKGVSCRELPFPVGDQKIGEYKFWAATVSNHGEKVSENPELIVEETIAARVDKGVWGSQDMKDGAVTLGENLQAGESIRVAGVADVAGNPWDMNVRVRDDNGFGSVSVEGIYGPAPPSTGDVIRGLALFLFILVVVGKLTYEAGKEVSGGERDKKLKLAMESADQAEYVKKLEAIVDETPDSDTQNDKTN